MQRIEATPSHWDDLRTAPARPARQQRLAFRFAAASPWLALPPASELELSLDAAYCRLPNAAPWLPGLLNLRGQILPVFDLLPWLDAAATDLATRRVLVVGKGDQAAAIRCSGEPRAMEWNSVQAPGEELPAALRPFVDAQQRAADGWVYAFDAVQWFRVAGRQQGAAAAASLPFRGEKGNAPVS